MYGLRNITNWIPAAGATIANAYGNFTQTALASTVTPSNIHSVYSAVQLTSAATGGLIGNAYAYNAGAPALDGSATTDFTNHYCYYANNSSGTANSTITNAYAFYGNQASSNTGVTNNWNLYMAGTAPNFFAGDMRFDKTVTAAGTTGARTINKNAGTVNFAATNTSLVVTNSLVTTNSIIICTVGTNDTTMKSVSAVAAAGSFTIHSNAAATAETRVNFIVIN
jgi:hypothetical protein